MYCMMEIYQNQKSFTKMMETCVDSRLNFKFPIFKGFERENRLKFGDLKSQKIVIFFLRIQDKGEWLTRT